MIDRLLDDAELYCHLCRRIDKLKADGAYDGGYACVKLAADKASDKT